jgi:chromosome segregation ATPase
VAAVTLADLEKELFKLHASLNRLQGQRDALTEQLKRDFGLDSWEAAREKYKELQAEVQEAQAAYKKICDEYQSFLAS